jgi:hypothetical protein
MHDTEYSDRSSKASCHVARDARPLSCEEPFRKLLADADLQAGQENGLKRRLQLVVFVFLAYTGRRFSKSHRLSVWNLAIWRL